MRARIAIVVLPFFAAVAAAGTPAWPGAAASRAGSVPALGGETEEAPFVASHQAAPHLRAARESGARAPFAKLPPHALTLRLVAPPAPSWLSRAVEAAPAPIAPPSAPRSCRGPPRA
jgi:hypothetical protein